MQKNMQRKKLPSGKRGILSMIFTYVQRGKSTIEEGAKDADMSQSEFIKAITAVGYKLPDGTKTISNNIILSMLKNN